MYGQIVPDTCPHEPCPHKPPRAVERVIITRRQSVWHVHSIWLSMWRFDLICQGCVHTLISKCTIHAYTHAFSAGIGGDNRTPLASTLSNVARFCSTFMYLSVIHTRLFRVLRTFPLPLMNKINSYGILYLQLIQAFQLHFKPYKMPYFLTVLWSLSSKKVFKPFPIYDNTRFRPQFSTSPSLSHKRYLMSLSILRTSNFSSVDYRYFTID